MPHALPRADSLRARVQARQTGTQGRVAIKLPVDVTLGTPLSLASPHTE